MTTIYVRLLEEGTDVFRPTTAEEVGRSLFRILPTESYDPDDEKWEFVPGTVVECETRKLSGGEVLVAVRIASEN